MLEGGRQSWFPRFRRGFAVGHSDEVRIGARERLATPPPKQDCLTASSISTDFSQGSAGRRRERPPPLVQPELSDSDFHDDEDEERSIFSEVVLPYKPTVSESRRGRRAAARRCEASSSRSDHTSPSSASSRDPSETMTSSRSSFLELIGLKKRREPIRTSSAALPPQQPILKKRKRKSSANELFVENVDGQPTNLEAESTQVKMRSRVRYTDEESDDEDSRGFRTDSRSESRAGSSSANSRRTSAAFLLPPRLPSPRRSKEGGAGRAESLRDENDGLRNEVDELRQRNARLIEQLREKSILHSKIQSQLHSVQAQMESLRNRCELNESLDRLTLKERLAITPTALLDSIEERLREFEAELQTTKADAASIQQLAMNTTLHERGVYQKCLEQLEHLQRENLRLLQARLNETGLDSPTLQRKLDMLPSYDALYSFTMGLVRKLSEMRWSFIEKSRETSRIEMDHIATQSSLLVTHAQIERLRLQLHMHGKHTHKRPASYHGEDLSERLVKRELNFFLPFRLQGSRVENKRRAAKKEMSSDAENGIEAEFLSLFGYAKCINQGERVRLPSWRSIDAPGRPPAPLSPLLARSRPFLAQPNPLIRERAREFQPKRPVSLVETEEHRRASARRYMSRAAYANVPGNVGSAPDSRLMESMWRTAKVAASLQDVASTSALRSPTTTPILTRRILQNGEAAKCLPPTSTSIRRERGPESGNSINNNNQPDRPSLTQQNQRDGEQRKPRIQRSFPVHMNSRLRPPTLTAIHKRVAEPNGQPTNVMTRGAQEARAASTSLASEGPLSRVASPLSVSDDKSRISKPSSSEHSKLSWLSKLKQYNKK